MCKTLRVDNYVITTPIIDIINKLKLYLTNGKLKEVRVNGDNIVVSCPHHSGGHESKAACNVFIGESATTAYGYFRCFACNEQGSFVKFVSECFDTSEEYAKDWLIKNFGVFAGGLTLTDDPIDLTKAKIAKAQKNINLDESILDNFQDWHPYLAQRKLSREVCNEFKVRYDPKLRQIIFPCYDINGNLKMLPSRAIDYKTFYIPRGVEKPVYCLNYIQKNNISTVLVVEGLIDCLTGYTFGYPTIAFMGNPAENQIEQINKSCIKVIYLMTDNDEAGEKFRTYIKNRLSPRIIVNELRAPAGKKDINDMTQEEFKKLVENAKNN